jgi:hypothetical protein
VYNTVIIHDRNLSFTMFFRIKNKEKKKKLELPLKKKMSCSSSQLLPLF